MLADFCALPEAKEANLSMAEVAALRLYTGPAFAALNAALRSQSIGEWATTIACCYSAVLKLSALSRPARVYRGVRETGMQLPREFFEEGASGFAGGVERSFMSTTKSPAVAIDYSGGEETPGSILVMDFEMGSRGAAVRWVSQYPHEEELLFPPLTTLSTRRVSQRGAKRIIVVSLDVSTSVLDTGDIDTPTEIPGAAAARRWLREVSGGSPDLLTLTSVDLSGSSITGSGAAHLALLLGRAQSAIPSLRTLSLHNTQLSDADVAGLAGALGSNRGLKELSLAANARLTAACSPALRQALASNTSLTALSLFNTGIALGSEGARQLGMGLLAAAKAGGTSALASLTLHSCALPVARLSGTDPVTSIDLSSQVRRAPSSMPVRVPRAPALHTLLRAQLQSIGFADGVLIAALLVANRSLTALHLQDNRLGEAAADLASVLKSGAAPRLQHLNLEHNNVSAKDKRALRQALVGRKVKLECLV